MEDENTVRENKSGKKRINDSDTNGNQDGHVNKIINDTTNGAMGITADKSKLNVYLLKNTPQPEKVEHIVAARPVVCIINNDLVQNILNSDEFKAMHKPVRPVPNTLTVDWNLIRMAVRSN
ncbi:unnamed protein product [Hermetia illucens]|uniref:Uncharacterized protein n=1 Tax=Hermetia illucens TaxID=343691 RepID=A0A7R8UV10_HERIL|nr:unnamed protein product [Hermetia illucens]